MAKGDFPPQCNYFIFFPPYFSGTRDSCQMHDLWRQLPRKVFIYLYVYDGNVVLKDLKFQAEDKGNFPFPICSSGNCLGRVCSGTRTKTCKIQHWKVTLY